jgi:hypothetical protein
MATGTKTGNIGPGQRRRRLLMGVGGLAAGVGLVAALIALRASPGWLLLAFVPFLAGMLGLVQAREHT